MNLPKRLTVKLNRLPPCLARLLAKEDGRLASDRILMARTGWGARRLRSVYQRATWDGVDAADIDTFHEACGLRWSSQNKQRWQLQTAFEKGGLKGLARLKHLKPRNPWEAKALNAHFKRIEKLLSQ